MGGFLRSLWEDIKNLRYSDVNEFIQEDVEPFLRSVFYEQHRYYTEIRDFSWYVAATVGVLILIIMIMYKPQYRLDKALLLREASLTLILLLLIKTLLLGPVIAIWSPVAWGFFALTNVLVLVELIREHFLIRRENSRPKLVTPHKIED